MRSRRDTLALWSYGLAALLVVSGIIESGPDILAMLVLTGALYGGYRLDERQKARHTAQAHSDAVALADTWRLVAEHARVAGTVPILFSHTCGAVFEPTQQGWLRWDLKEPVDALLEEPIPPKSGAEPPRVRCLCGRWLEQRSLMRWDFATSRSVRAYASQKGHRRRAEHQDRLRSKLHARQIRQALATDDDLRWRVFARDEYSCQDCGSKSRLTIDHIHPVSLGGANEESNLRTLCRPCNSRKGARVVLRPGPSAARPSA